MQSTSSDTYSYTLLNNRYKKIGKLGEGAYGTVYMALDMKPDGKRRKVD